MFKFLKKLFKKRIEEKPGTGAVPDMTDDRDLVFSEAMGGGGPVNWEKGFDIEKELNIKIPIKSQNGSSSCVGQGWAYYVAVLNAVETGIYDEASAKSIYSQIFLPKYGAYIRDGGKLITKWGALKECDLTSYLNGTPPNESFMRDLTWKTEKEDRVAKVLQAKEYRKISTYSMEEIAMAIRDNNGVVGGLYCGNNGSWKTGEPTPSEKTGGHCIFFGKFGVDKRGKYIATPNSWGERKTDDLHPDGWQKLRKEYFNSRYMFNPWTLTDKPNVEVPEKTRLIMENNEKKIIIEGEGHGRKGVIIDGKLREILDDANNRGTAACLYVLANNGFGQTVKTKEFDEMEKRQNF